LSRPNFGALLAKAQAEYEIVLIDTPPATEYADAQTVAYRAGDVLLVSRQDHTRVADTERAVREISDASARIVGTLMNAY
jgi:Mrp family chromosome partitioning ATPase